MSSFREMTNIVIQKRDTGQLRQKRALRGRGCRRTLSHQFTIQKPHIERESLSSLATSFTAFLANHYSLQMFACKVECEKERQKNEKKLLHFHIGSQIPSTTLLADGVVEAAHTYCELLRLGAQMRDFDIGGGLGIDYDGSKTSKSDLFVAYGLEEYAAAVVHDRRNVKHPVNCSESGRWFV